MLEFAINHRDEIIIGIIVALAGALLIKLWNSIIPWLKRIFMFSSKKYYLNRMRQSGITNFYVGRSEWIIYRDPAELREYLWSATKSVQIATYWLAQGTIEGIQDSYLELTKKGVRVDIVMIDPNEHMINILSEDMHIRPEIIRQNIENAYNQLCNLKEKLSDNEKSLLRIGLSSALPQAAVIMIDAKTNNSKIQLEFRPYRAARNNSFSIELKANSNANLHNQLEEAWEHYFEDANYLGNNSSKC